MAFEGIAGSSPDQDCASYLMSLKFSRPSSQAQAQAQAQQAGQGQGPEGTRTAKQITAQVQPQSQAQAQAPVKRPSPKRMRPHETSSAVPVPTTATSSSTAPAPSTVMHTPSPAPLATNQDPRHLPRLECILRAECCELFVVSPEDERKNTYVKYPTPPLPNAHGHPAYPNMHMSSPRAGTVGIRCAFTFAAHTAGGAGGPLPPGASVFPSNLGDIYRCVEQMKLGHFQHCPHVPSPIKNEIINDCIKNGKNSPLALRHMERSIEDQIRESSKQQYWIDSAKNLGLIDDYEYSGAQTVGPVGRIVLAPSLNGFVRMFDPASFHANASAAANTASMNGRSTAFANAVAMAGANNRQYHMDIPNAALSYGHGPPHPHSQHHMMHNQHPNHNIAPHNNNANGHLYIPRPNMPMTKRQPITGQNLSDYDVYDQEPFQQNLSNIPQSEERFEKLMGNTELVDLSDRQYIPDYIFLAMAQLKPCSVISTDRIGTYKNRDIGFKGMCCKHCGGEPGFGRYFPETVRSLSQTTTSQTIVKHVAYKCLKCPPEVRDAVKQLKVLQENKDKEAKIKRRSRFDERPKYGSRKVFFQHLWARLHGEGGDCKTNNSMSKNKKDKQVDTTPKTKKSDKNGKESSKRQLGSSPAEPLSERKRTRTVSPGSFDDVDAAGSHSYLSTKPPPLPNVNVGLHGMSKKQMMHHHTAVGADIDTSSQENRSRFVSYPG